MHSWESLLTRARNRRDRLETPSPAHDMVVDAIERLPSGKMTLLLRASDSWPLYHAKHLFIKAVVLAREAEALATETGLLRDRQLANDALSYALRVARRIVDQTQRR
jgi:hypothetical protein